jgi:hypothetical protein
VLSNLSWAIFWPLPMSRGPDLRFCYARQANFRTKAHLQGRVGISVSETMKIGVGAQPLSTGARSESGLWPGAGKRQLSSSDSH